MVDIMSINFSQHCIGRCENGILLGNSLVSYSLLRVIRTTFLFFFDQKSKKKPDSSKQKVF